MNIAFIVYMQYGYVENIVNPNLFFRSVYFNVLKYLLFLISLINYIHLYIFIYANVINYILFQYI